MVHNQIQSHVSHCFHFYLLWLKNNTWQQTTFLFKIVLKCNLSWFLSTPSIWLCYSILSKTQGRNKCIIGVIYLSGWVMHAIYSWLYHSVSAPVSDRRSSTSCNEKKSAVQSNLIYSQEAGCHHNLQFLSLKHVADWHQLRKKQRWCQSLLLSASLSAIKDKNLLLGYTDFSAKKSAVTYDDFRPLSHSVKCGKTGNQSEKVVLDCTERQVQQPPNSHDVTTTHAYKPSNKNMTLNDRINWRVQHFFSSFKL